MAVEPGIIDRLIQGVRYTITGVKDDTWFSPLQPLPPSVPKPEEVKGRIFDYPIGYNIVVTPRAYEPIGFRELRALADNYDLMRLAIETVKDEMAKMSWQLKVREDLLDTPGDEKKYSSQIKKIKDFLRYPDNEHSWDAWLRMILEEMLVIDALSIYPRKTKGGSPYALEIIDGSTITRKINADGRTPLPPDTAYQQVLKGIPAVDYTADELIYAPRNPRAHKIYGYSPVEQCMMTVNIALRRQIHQLEYYTSGNMADVLIGVPKEWTVDQIKQFQEWWDSLHRGNLGERRAGKFVPADAAKGVYEMKAALLKDAYDDWLASIICFAFGISREALIKQMNRASSQSNRDVAMQQGLFPKLRWFKDLMDYIITKYFGEPDIEFAWDTDKESQPLEQAQINQINVNAGILTVDEVRADMGRDPMSEEDKAVIAAAKPKPFGQEGNQPPGEKPTGEKPTLPKDTEKLEKAVGDTEIIKIKMVDADKVKVENNIDFTEGGNETRYTFIPEGEIWITDNQSKEGKIAAKVHEFTERLARKELGLEYDEAHYKLADPCEAVFRKYLSGGVAPAPEETEKLEKLKKKVKKITTRIDRERPVILKARDDLKAWLKEVFDDTKKQIKAIDFHLDKAESEVNSRVKKILDQIDLEGWAVITDATEEILTEVTKDGLIQALIQIGLSEAEMTSTMSDKAFAYAKDRAAELVGKKWVNGELIDNPKAEWAITDTTRDYLRSDITQAVEEGWSQQKLIDQLIDNRAFSGERAEMIARTEMSFADQRANMIAYKESGVVVGKYWLLSTLHTEDDECDDNADQDVIDLDEAFESGDMEAPSHPSCLCDCMPVLEGEEE